jgi:hypothetical protein
MIQKVCFLWMLSLLFLSCKKTDEEKIIGRWQNDRDWFQYEKDKTYSSGKEEFKMVDHFKYTIDAATKQLNMYTDRSDKTYYLIYDFIGDDTLLVRNAMSSNKTMIKFYKVKPGKDAGKNE